MRTRELNPTSVASIVDNHLKEQKDKKPEALKTDVYTKNPFDMDKKEDKRVSPLFDHPSVDIDKASTIEPETVSGAKLAPANNVPFVQRQPMKTLDGEEMQQVNSARPDLDTNWLRSQLPSRCLPSHYDFNEVYMRPLTVSDLSLVYAANTNSSFSTLVDALDNAVDIDIRKLTPADFNFAMYWIRENTYPKSPMKLTFNTRYGNRQEETIRSSEFEIIELKMTKAEVRQWADKGIGFPTVRDMEFIQADALQPQDQWMLEHAQYVIHTPKFDKNGKPDYTNYVEEKLALLQAMGPQGIQDIKKFAKLITHGMIEKVTIVDRLFEPIKAAEYFEENAKNIMETVIGLTEDDEEIDGTYTPFINSANALVEEAKQLREAVARGEKPVAEKETVAVNISATDFFPEL